MYFAIIFFCIAVITGFNLAFSFNTLTLINLVYSFLLVLAPSIPIAVLVRLLPKKLFSYKNKIFQVKKNERNFYLKIKIKDWKDKVPELGKLVNFSKDKIENPNDTKYIEKFLDETCYAEVLHISGLISGFVFMWGMFFINKLAFLTMALPIAVVYACVNLVSIFIQRFNRPRLLIGLKRLQQQHELQNQQQKLKEIA